MVYSGFQIEPSYKGGYCVSMVQIGKIVEEKNVADLDEAKDWIVNKEKYSMSATYSANFKFINDFKIKVGDKIVEKSDTCDATKLRSVEHIHPLYGWLSDKYSQIDIDKIVRVFHAEEVKK